MIIAARPAAQPGAAVLRQRRADHRGAARRARRAAHRSVGPAPAPGARRSGAAPRDPRCCSARGGDADGAPRWRRRGPSSRRCDELAGARRRRARARGARRLPAVPARRARRRERSRPARTRARARARAARVGRSAAGRGARRPRSGSTAATTARAIWSRRRRARSSARCASIRRSSRVARAARRDRDADRRRRRSAARVRRQARGRSRAARVARRADRADPPARRASTAATLDEVIAKAAELRAELDGAHRPRRGARRARSRARAAAEAAAVAAAAALTQAAREGGASSSRRRSARRSPSSAWARRGSSVVIEPRPLGPTGADRIELMLASNKGEEPRPLAKIASGGELSRIMLALKLALRRADEVATYVFDEVDAGIGGATAQVVGAQIRAVADQPPGPVRHAPAADRGVRRSSLSRREDRGRRPHRDPRAPSSPAAARKDELARMLGGHATSSAKAHAAELLADAARTRASAG